MKTLVIAAIAVLFFQILHIFEEIALGAFKLEKGERPMRKYLRVASVLVFISVSIIICLVLELKFAPYAALFMAVLSIGNVIAHMALMIKKSGRHGYGFPSVIPYGIAGFMLFWRLII